MHFELHGSEGPIATTSDPKVALALARAWLRSSKVQPPAPQTCVVQVRNSAGQLVGDHVVTLRQR